MYLLSSMAADIATYLGVPIGLWISFRIVGYPDLSLESLFVFGGVIYATAVGGNNLLMPLFFGLASVAIGFGASVLRNRVGVHPILISLAAGYLFYSVSLLMLGGPNRYFGLGASRPDEFVTASVALEVFVTAVIVMSLGLRTSVGLRILASGSNPELARRQGFSPTVWQGVALSVSFLLVMISGALFAWRTGSIDISHGSGLLLIAIFVVVLTRALQSRVRLAANAAVLTLSLAGYLIILQAALRLGMPAQWLRGVNAAALLLLVVLLPKKTGQILKL